MFPRDTRRVKPMSSHGTVGAGYWNESIGGLHHHSRQTRQQRTTPPLPEMSRLPISNPNVSTVSLASPFTKRSLMTLRNGSTRHELVIRRNSRGSYYPTLQSQRQSWLAAGSEGEGLHTFRGRYWEGLVRRRGPCVLPESNPTW